MDTNSTTKPDSVTPEQIDWVNRQPIVDTPSLPRLRAALAAAGLHPVELMLNSDGETLTLWLNQIDGMRGLDQEQRLRKVIKIFRSAGFAVGHTELGIEVIDGMIVSINSLVAPLGIVCTKGAVPVDRLPARQLSDAALDDLIAQYDHAMEAQTTSELANRWPKLPFEDVNDMPMRLRRRHEQFIHAVWRNVPKG